MFKIFYKVVYCEIHPDRFYLLVGKYASMFSFGFHRRITVDHEMKSDVFGFKSKYYGKWYRNRCFNLLVREGGVVSPEDYIGVFGKNLKGSVMFFENL